MIQCQPFTHFPKELGGLQGIKGKVIDLFDVRSLIEVSLQEHHEEEVLDVGTYPFD